MKRCSNSVILQTFYRMAAQLGFEPRLCGSEPHVLPLDDRATIYQAPIAENIVHDYYTLIG